MCGWMGGICVGGWVGYVWVDGGWIVWVDGGWIVWVDGVQVEGNEVQNEVATYRDTACSGNWDGKLCNLCRREEQNIMVPPPCLPSLPS